MLRVPLPVDTMLPYIAEPTSLVMLIVPSPASSTAPVVPTNAPLIWLVIVEVWPAAVSSETP